MKYAEKECADCGILMPSNYMFRRSERVKTGVSHSRTLGQSSDHQKRTVHYKFQQIFICPRCTEVRRENRIRLTKIALAFLIAAIALTISFCTSLKPSKKTAIREERANPIPNEAAPPINEKHPTADASQFNVIDEVDKINSPSGNAEKSELNESNENVNLEKLGFTDQEIIKIIRSKIDYAIDYQNNANWNVTGENGIILHYGRVMVYPLQSEPGTQCTQFNVIIIEAGQDREIYSGTRCR